MSRPDPHKRGQINLQVWIDNRIVVKARARLVMERKTMRQLITDFLVWYSGGFDEPEAVEATEDDQAGEESGDS